jgi:hypothetical protein
MTTRVSMKDLELQAAAINGLKGSPAKYGANALNEKFRANVGHRYIFAGHNHYSLACVINENGGVSCRFGSKTKRDLYNKLTGYIEAMDEESRRAVRQLERE